MAVQFVAVSAASDAASGNVTVTPPATVDDHVMICAVTTRDNVALSFPAGWTIYQAGNNGATLRSTVAWKVCVGAEAPFTITHTGGDGIVARLAVYKGVDVSSPIDSSSIRHNASSSTCTATGITTIAEECLVLFTMHDSDDGASTNERLNSVAMAERFDSVSQLGLDEAVSLSDLRVGAPGGTGNATGTLSLGPDVNTGILTALKPRRGIWLPDGPGTKIVAYDSALAADATKFTRAELAAAYPAELFLAPDSPVKRYVSVGGICYGDDLSTGYPKAWTSFGDSEGGGIDFKTPGTLSYGGNGQEVELSFATAGPPTYDYGNIGLDLAWDVAPDIFGQDVTFAGARFVVKTGQFNLRGAGAIADCVLEHLGTAATDSIGLGGSGLYRTAVISNNVGGPVLTYLVGVGGPVTVIANGNPTTFYRPPSSLGTLPRMRLIGTPSVADVWFGAVPPSLVIFDQPRWSGNAPPFAFDVPPDRIDSVKETSRFDAKTQDSAHAPLAGKDVKLVDAVGEKYFETTTDAEGRIVFSYTDLVYPTALEPNSVYIRDHYCESDLIYKIRERSPFTFSCNYPGGANYDSALETYIETYEWPGIDDGKFTDVMLVVTLRPPAAPPAPVVPITVDQVPLPADGEIRFEGPVQRIS